jgi:hypothetical protein
MFTKVEKGDGKLMRAENKTIKIPQVSKYAWGIYVTIVVLITVNKFL